MRLFYSFIVLFFCYSSSLGNISDSLANLIANSTSDTAQIRHKVELAMFEENFDMNYWDSLLVQSRKLNYTASIPEIFFFKAYINMISGKVDSLESILKKNTPLFESQQNYNGMQLMYTMHGFKNIMKGAGDSAIHYMLAALDAAKRTQKKDIIASAHVNIGYAYIASGNINQAVIYNHNALKLTSEGGHYSLNEIALMAISQLGSIYLKLNQHDKALEHLNKGIIIAQSYQKKAFLDLFYNNMGVLHTQKKRYKKAIQAYKMYDYSEGVKSNPHSAISNICNRAKTYLKMNEIDSALSYIKIAKVYIHQFHNPILQNSYYSVLGSYFSKVNQIDSAIYYLEKTLQFAAQSKSVNHYNNLALSKNYAKKGSYEKAYEMLNQFVAVEDSIKDQNELRHIMSAELDATLSKKEDEFREANQRKNIILIISGIIGLALTVFLGMVYNMFRLKRRSLNIISEQKRKVEEQNQEILSSIKYAEKIQTAILPSIPLIKEDLKDMFIYFRPKDIVSGDFYWFERVDDNIYFSAADCTGHGVPGAMVSVICSNSLSKTVKELNINKPSDILNKVTEIVEDRFDKGSSEEVKDGMDLALCKLNIKTNHLEYAGANNPLWIIRNGEVLETKADPQPIGKYFAREPFTNHSIQLEKGDTIYLFSDGFQDQFGGERGKKYKAKPFKRFLLSIQDKSMEEQERLLHEEFERYKGPEEQIDDVCVVSVRI